MTRRPPLAPIVKGVDFRAVIGLVPGAMHGDALKLRPEAHFDELAVGAVTPGAHPGHELSGAAPAGEALGGGEKAREISRRLGAGADQRKFQIAGLGAALA